MSQRGSDILASALKCNGVDVIFHVPGESFLSVLDAIETSDSSIQLVTCRHEGGMAVMAEAYGKLTGRPGVAFVTRSPGATNAVNGVHTAYQDASPMVLFVGQVKRPLMEREAFMSYDFRQMFAPMAKWVAQIDDASRIPEFVQRAFHTALSGRMGPVVLILPEDMLEEVKPAPELRPVKRVSYGTPSGPDMAGVRAALAASHHPLLIVGGSGWTSEARDHLQRFMTANRVPAVTAFRRRDYIDNRHPCYAGELGIGSDKALLAQIQRSDLLIVINDALTDVNTIGHGYMEGFSLFRLPNPKQTLIHVHRDPEEMNRAFQADQALVVDIDRFCEALADLDPVPVAWDAWTTALREQYEADFAQTSCPGPIDLPAVFKGLRERLPDDAIITNGVGAYAGWSQRYFHHHLPHTQLGPISGSMGYGLPAAIAAKLCHPERVVVGVAGDGCFMMTSEELATAVKYKLGIVILVINNNMFGTIRIHAENKLDGRTTGTDLANPEFVDFARSFGAFAERVSTTAEFEPAFERALAQEGPALLELCIDPDAINTRYSLTALQERRQAAKA